MNIKKEILANLVVVYVFVALFAIFIVIKLFVIQFIQGDKWASKIKNIERMNRTIEAVRGNIFTEDGKLLAISVPYYKLAMDMGADGLKQNLFDQKVDSLALCLARLFQNKTTQQFKEELVAARKRKDRYFVIHSKVDYSQKKKVLTFPILNKGKFKGGLILEMYSKRVQPHVNLAARTVGYLYEGEGRALGIEGAFDSELRGVKGSRLMQKISGGNWMPLEEGEHIDPQNGKDIVTTINLDLQDVAENALLEQLINVDADHGCAILMEVKTGEIRAIANLGKDEDGNYRELFNYAVGESNEPGSTFKLASIIVGLEDGYLHTTDMVETGSGITYFNGFPIRDSKGGHGLISLQQAFELSSNVGISKLIYKNYSGKSSRFISKLRDMNLGEKLGIQIKGEGEPYLKSTKDKLWSGISLPQISIGYEVKITPLQTLTFYNAVANNGVMVKPSFVKEVRQFSQTVKTFQPEIINNSIASEKTLKIVRKFMEGVVERGTATNLQATKYKIAGKTGTAQLANTDQGYIGETGKKYLASFCGYFPADNPKFSCIVVINSPRKVSYYGNAAAGPVFKAIADKVYASELNIHKPINDKNFAFQVDIPYSKSGSREELEYLFTTLKIPVRNAVKKSEYVVTTSHDRFVELQKKTINKNTVPKVEGMGATEALFLLESAGLKVILKGRGVVQSQSLEPGSHFKKGEKIVIELGS